MKKIFGLVLLLVLAIAIVPAVSQAECVSDLGVATACADDSGVSLDGDAGNPDPLDGYITVSTDGDVCASDEGSPGDEDSDPLCLSDAG